MSNGFSDIPRRSLKGVSIPFDALKFVSEDSANHYRFVPIGFADGVLDIGLVDPDNIEARDAVGFIATQSGVPYKLFAISIEDFEDAMKGYEGLRSEVGKALSQLGPEEAGAARAAPARETLTGREPTDAIREKSAGDLEAAISGGGIKAEKFEPVGTAGIVEEAPVTKIVAVIIQHATEGNASDVHIEPTSEKLRVRFRVDGVMYTSLFLPLAVHEAIVARIKILTNMKLDEKRKPQDGRFSARIKERKVDFRVSTFPSFYGEKVVIRILDQDKGVKRLDKLGMTERNLALIRRAIEKPYGIVLITGPTGSGKSTTLYSMLQELDREKSNVVSLEDPVEFSIAGINQSQVRPEIGYTFANGLRSILRQDPDIIMVGEIRDAETAQLAIQAALTGHLVFSTLHTNNAIGVVPRLVDMGVDPYLIAPTLVLAVAQRLVRTLCDDSKEPLEVDGAVKIMIDKQFADLPDEYRRKIQIPREVYQAKSSPTCASGTRGRLAVFEMFEITKEIEEIILKKPNENDIYQAARKQGMLTMREDALLKAFNGEVPFSEVSRL
ncbi:MAG: type II/IV secretion system protein [Candidatus Vogelbacteria bacterium]|nr:type II/IV secretion system protein [Candidatus Vogelbacteria bacterium]